MNNTKLQTPELVVTNFHRRFTGVSATADAVLSQQLNQFRLCLVGDKLPSGPVPITYRQAISLCRRPPENRPFAIWHVRRNLEMAAAIFARDVLRLPIRIVFTSAAQRLHSLVPRHLIAKMDAVVATTAKAGAFVPKLAAVVPHGVDTARFTPAEDRSAAWKSLGYGGQCGIGIVGRVRPEKGTDLFVDAMIRVLPHRPDFTAIIIGRTMPSDAPFEASLKARIQSAGLADRILFVGEHAPQAVPGIIRSLSLLVAPARYEGYGMTPLEAMASGVPVVATKTGAYEEMLGEGIAGKTVEIGDLDGLAIAIAAITEERQQLLELGTKAFERANQRFSLKYEVRNIGNVYDELWHRPLAPHRSNPLSNCC